MCFLKNTNFKQQKKQSVCRKKNLQFKNITAGGWGGGLHSKDFKLTAPFLSWINSVRQVFPGFPRGFWNMTDVWFFFYQRRHVVVANLLLQRHLSGLQQFTSFSCLFLTAVINSVSSFSKDPPEQVPKSEAGSFNKVLTITASTVKFVPALIIMSHF